MLMHRRKPAAMGWQCRYITITAVLLLRCTILKIISIISKNGEEVFKPTSSRHLGRKYSVNLCYIIAIHELLNLHGLRFEIVYIHQSTLSCTAEARTQLIICVYPSACYVLCTVSIWNPLPRHCPSYCCYLNTAVILEEMKKYCQLSWLRID